MNSTKKGMAKALDGRGFQITPAFRLGKKNITETMGFSPNKL